MVCSCSITTGISDSSQPNGPQPSRLFSPWDFPGENTGGDCHALLQWVFPTQGSNPGLLHCKCILYRLSHPLVCINTFSHMVEMGKQWKQCQTLFWGALKSLQMCDYSHEIKRCLLPGRKVMTNLDSILKSRDITLPSKVRLVKALVFPVVMYGYESWTVKKAERQRMDAFELWCWRRLFESPMDCKEIQPVHPKDQPWDFFGRTDAKAETPVLWPPHAKS